MRRKTQGFALLQALFFMMFIMAVISMTMLMSSQRAVNSEGARLATDAYPALHAFFNGVKDQLTPQTPSISAEQYFSEHPLSSSYVTKLKEEGIGDPNENLSITLT